jgi:ubiquinone biosynthesis monooxygenase Coq7
MPKPYFKPNDQEIDSIIRINQAGEYAAQVIYQNQISDTRDCHFKEILEEMLACEKQHLEFFNQQMLIRKTRPTLLTPLWHFLSLSLGRISSKISNKHMMIATDAVEEVIQDHYQQQIKRLEGSDQELLRLQIIKFRLEELDHQKVAKKHVTDLGLFDRIFTKIIQIGCKAAIELSKTI